MASLSYIDFSAHHAVFAPASITWVREAKTSHLKSVPQIFWADGNSWREANLWAIARAKSTDVKIETIQSDFLSILVYANWLEESETDWTHFPLRRQDRCLVKFRGWLVSKRNDAEISPSYATKCMGCAVKLYRWFLSVGVLSPELSLWSDGAAKIKIHDCVGFERSITVGSTDLAIRNRRAPRSQLEDGLTPVSTSDRDSILRLTAAKASIELFQMLSLGFFTGLRVRTIADLKVQTLERAVPHPLIPSLALLSVGPGADPPVHTKFGVTGQIPISRPHLDELRSYAFSPRRLLRESKATAQDRDLIFLTKYGNRYADGGSDKSRSINVEMSRLRSSGAVAGLKVLSCFKFHQSRCTFATEVAALAIASGDEVNAISVVKELLLHRDEATSLKYIKFAHQLPVKAAMANEFSKALLGAISARATNE